MKLIPSLIALTMIVLTLTLNFGIMSILGLSTLLLLIRQKPKLKNPKAFYSISIACMILLSLINLIIFGKPVLFAIAISMAIINLIVVRNLKLYEKKPLATPSQTLLERTEMEMLLPLEYAKSSFSYRALSKLKNEELKTLHEKLKTLKEKCKDLNEIYLKVENEIFHKNLNDMNLISNNYFTKAEIEKIKKIMPSLECKLIESINQLSGENPIEERVLYLPRMTKLDIKATLKALDQYFIIEKIKKIMEMLLPLGYAKSSFSYRALSKLKNEELKTLHEELKTLKEKCKELNEIYLKIESEILHKNLNDMNFISNNYFTKAEIEKIKKIMPSLECKLIESINQLSGEKPIEERVLYLPRMTKLVIKATLKALDQYFIIEKIKKIMPSLECKLIESINQLSGEKLIEERVLYLPRMTKLDIKTTIKALDEYSIQETNYQSPHSA